MSTPKIIGPVDQRGNPIHRSMGLPIVQKDIKLGNATYYVPIFDLTGDSYKTRVFGGISIENPSASSKIILASNDLLLPAGMTDFLEVGTQQFFTLDNLQFGPGIIDDTSEKRTTVIYAKLDIAQGTPASGTIDYSVSGQPSDENTIEINGIIYEFSDDESKDPNNSQIVAIGASADDTWTNLVNKVNAVDPGCRLSIDTATDIVTVTAVYGGDYGQIINLNDGGTGATLSGASLSGGSGGVLPTFHIW